MAVTRREGQFIAIRLSRQITKVSNKAKETFKLCNATSQATAAAVPQCSSTGSSCVVYNVQQLFASIKQSYMVLWNLARRASEEKVQVVQDLANAQLFFENQLQFIEDAISVLDETTCFSRGAQSTLYRDALVKMKHSTEITLVKIKHSTEITLVKIKHSTETPW
ncbi:UNVERIFIED_CONTAM: hypothetical protein FKN15_076450 [Acipenser sinensis]